MEGPSTSSSAASASAKRKLHYAQIVMGLKGNGKSTYCKLMASLAETKGRRFRIVNLDPSAGVLAYEKPVADIRDHISADEFAKIQDQSGGDLGRGFEFVLNYVLEHPDWLFGAIGDMRETDYFLFDCPGEEEYHAHLNVLKVFAAMLVVKNVRTCSVFVRDSRLALNGYSFIASCLTPLVSYVSLSIPHFCVMMKVDMLSDDDKARLHLFINSDIKDVLRYENTQRSSSSASSAASPNTPTAPAEVDHTAHFAAIAAAVLDGHSLVRKKYVPLDIREDGQFKSFLSLIDDVLGVNIDIED